MFSIWSSLKFILWCEASKIPLCGNGMYVTHHAERDLIGIAKSINPGQPFQSTQADHG